MICYLFWYQICLCEYGLGEVLYLHVSMKYNECAVCFILFFFTKLTALMSEVSFPADCQFTRNPKGVYIHAVFAASCSTLH